MELIKEISKNKLYALALCQYCNTWYVVRKYRLKNNRRKYCSYSCTAKARHKNSPQYGEDNSNWKNGISKDNYYYKKTQKERYPERVKARDKAYYALRHKKIKKQPCEICGEKKVQMHHEDYSKPLEIIWLCRNCHRAWHEANI